MAVFKYLFTRKVHSQKWGLIEKGCLIELNDDTLEGRNWVYMSQVAVLYVGDRRGDNLPESMKAKAPPTEKEIEAQKAANIFNKLAGGTLPPRPLAVEYQQAPKEVIALAFDPEPIEPKKSGSPFKKK